MELPRFILLKSNANNKFLCYTKEKDDHSFLHFSYQVNDWKAATIPQQEKNDDHDDDESEKIGFHHLKFEVEKAKSVEGLVHIRSCYNNKYWARKSIDNDYMEAIANEAEEDQSKWSCTLFKPIFLNGVVDDNLLPMCNSFNISLLHVSQSGQCSLRTTSLTSSDNKCVLALHAIPPESSSSDPTLVLTAFNVEATAILPEYATFMGYNDKYLASIHEPMVFLLGFKFSASDVGEKGVAQKVATTNNLPQPTSIIDDASNKAWFAVLQYGIILSDDLSKGTLFAPIKVGDKHVALKCMTTNRFVTSDENGFLVPSATTITQKAMLRVGEPVRAREIVEATYDLANSRVYGASSVEKYSDSRSNHTSVEQEGAFEVNYKTSQTTKWSQSVTVSIGVGVNWKAGIPSIGESGVDVSYEHVQNWEWGKEEEEEKEISYTQGIKIPPGKRVTLKVVAMKAFCDVPFTCKVCDLMTDGRLREYTKNDGLYSGCNEFQFRTNIIEEDL